MKNLKLIFVLSLLILPIMVVAQDQVQTLGFFAKIKEWVQTNALEMLVVFLGGIGAKHGWTQIIKKYAAKGAVVCHLGEMALGTAEHFLNDVSNTVKEDGTIQQNSIKEVFESGKSLVTTVGDMKVIFQPKI